MTLEELKKIPLRYVFGMTGESNAIRVYSSDDGKIKRIIRTKKRKLEWGKGIVTYAIGENKKEYTPAR